MELRSDQQCQRRVASVTNGAAVSTIIPNLAQAILNQKEADVVLQAVGRVRPFTRPREVITFHCGTLPGVQYDHNFRSLAEMRAFFGLHRRRDREHHDRAADARRLRQDGLCNAPSRPL